MLLDEYLPTFDVRSKYAIRIAAAPERVFGLLRITDFDCWGIMRQLYALRTLASLFQMPQETLHRFHEELRRERYTLNSMLRNGLTLLGERAREELVLGAVGRFWRARGELVPTSATKFHDPAPFGTAKLAWNFTVGLCKDGGTELRTETRVLCEDVPTCRLFRRYWMWTQPFSGLIRLERLAAVRSAVERRPYPTVDPPFLMQL